MATSNFKLFRYIAKNYNNLLEGKTKAIQAEGMANPIQEYIVQEMNLIKKDLGYSRISGEDKELIKLYMDYYEGDDKLVLNKELQKNIPKFRIRIFHE